MKLKELEDEVIALKKSLTNLQDINDIKILQNSYGYYMEHWMVQEIVDLFSDGPDVSLEFASRGSYLGKESVKRYYGSTISNPQFLHEYLMANGVVHVDPDGKTAKGRFYGLGFLALPLKEGVWEGLQSIIYENEYVKENDKWKIKKLRLSGIFSCPFQEGWVKPEVKVKERAQGTGPKPDVLDIGVPTNYPAGYIAPFHYKHPVTGKKVNERLGQQL